MLPIVITMVVIVAVAGLVVAFVAFPHRGEALPGAAWLGAAMGRASGALPTLDAHRGDDLPDDAETHGAVLAGALREERDSRA